MRHGFPYRTIGELVTWINSRRQPDQREMDYRTLWRWLKRADALRLIGGRLVTTDKLLKQAMPELYDQLQQEAWEQAHGLK